MPPSPSHQLRLLPAWLLDLIFVLPGLYIMLSNTVRAQMPLPLLPQQPHLLRKSIDYCNIVSVATNVSKDTFHLPLIYSIGVTIHGTPWDDILYERSHMCALISQRAFVDATFLRKWLPCCFPFCRYGAANWPYHKYIWDMRWAEDVTDQVCCAGADEDSGIGEIVVAAVAAIDALLLLLLQVLAWWHVIFISRCLVVDALKTMLPSNVTSDLLALSFTSLVHYISTIQHALRGITGVRPCSATWLTHWITGTSIFFGVTIIQI